MTLKEQILEDIKHYMKEKDIVALNAVRMLKSEVKNAEIAAIKELDDAGVIKVVQSSIKKRKDSAEIYAKNGRQELADKELAEIKVLEKYLPAQLDDEAIKKIINEVIASLDDSMKKNFGAVMKAVMAKVGASAEGKKVSELIKGII